MPDADSAGGVVISGGNRVLLREPTGHFGGNAWTFAKTRVGPQEHHRAAAARAVLEKTGYSATPRACLQDDFRGTTSRTIYYLMDAVHPPSPHNWQTSSLRWVRFEEARELISLSTDAKGRARDLAVLEAAVKMLGHIAGAEHLNVHPEDFSGRLGAMPPEHVVLRPQWRYSAEDIIRIRRGFFSGDMDDKWFIYFTGERLRLHRSWTGILIFDVGFHADPAGGGVHF